MRRMMQMTAWLSGVAASAALAGLALAASPVDRTTWQVKLTVPSSNVPVVDQFRFGDGTFLSSYFEGQGFPMSRYTPREEKDRPFVWETLQTGKNQATISWHGEVEGNTVRGVALLRQSGKPNTTFTFTGTKVTMPKPRPAAPEAPAVVAPPAAQPKAEAPAAKPPAARKSKPKAKHTAPPASSTPAAPGPAAPAPAPSTPPPTTP